MSNKPHRVRSLDAVYDEVQGFLVLNLLFLDMGERRIVPWHKDDFLFKGQKGVPDIEMRRTGKMIKNREFRITIDDDPNRKQFSEKEQMTYASMFNKRITEELGKVTEGLADEEGQISRKLHRMGKEGKFDFAKMYNNESALRDRLGLGNQW